MYGHIPLISISVCPAGGEVLRGALLAAGSVLILGEILSLTVSIRATTDWVRDRCRELGYRLYVIQPQPKFVYAVFVL